MSCGFTHNGIAVHMNHVLLITKIKIDMNNLLGFISGKVFFFSIVMTGLHWAPRNKCSTINELIYAPKCMCECKGQRGCFFSVHMVQCEHKGQRCCISHCVVFCDDLHQQTVTLTPPLSECWNYSILLKSSKPEDANAYLFAVEVKKKKKIRLDLKL